jgi:hypothetical protein
MAVLVAHRTVECLVESIPDATLTSDSTESGSPACSGVSDLEAQYESSYTAAERSEPGSVHPKESR